MLATVPCPYWGPSVWHWTGTNLNLAFYDNGSRRQSSGRIEQILRSTPWALRWLPLHLADMLIANSALQTQRPCEDMGEKVRA